MLKERVTVDEAGSLIRQQIRLRPSEYVSFLESHNRYLAEDVTATAPMPLWDNSAMDGYAVRSADIAAAADTAPVTLVITEEVFAGKVPEKKVGPGCCARIFTGAMIPDGADAVVRQEDVAREGDRAVFTTPAAPGTDIRKKAEDVQTGQVIMKRGEKISSSAVGLLAAMRITRVKVFNRPRVFILATGNELADADSSCDGTRIVNSNSYTLHAACIDAGAEPVLGGIVRDSRESIEEAFHRAAGFDIVLTTGGVSVGEYDLVKDVFGALGVNWIFWKVRIRPGQPVAFGTAGQTLYFGLPGNPVSSSVAFDRFVRPAIGCMFGAGSAGRMRFVAESLCDISRKPGFAYYLRGILESRDGRLFVDLAGNQSSAALSELVRADCYVIVDGSVPVRKGDRVAVEIFKLAD